jgi:hypothetical protein
VLSLDLPLTLSCRESDTFAIYQERVEAQLKLMASKKGYPPDLPLRYPALSRLNLSPPSIVFGWTDDLSQATLADRDTTGIFISTRGDACRVLSHERIDPLCGIQDHLTCLLEQKTCSTNIPSLRLLPSAEEQRLLAWSSGADQITNTYTQRAPCCVHELFEARAAQNPAAIALVCDETQLSYKELDERSEEIANHLRAMGVCPEVNVGVYLEKSPELVISLIAIMKAGGSFIPLDPSLPIDRIKYILDEACPLVIVTHSRLQAHIKYLSLPLCVVDRLNTRPFEPCLRHVHIRLYRKT